MKRRQFGKLALGTGAAASLSSLLAAAGAGPALAQTRAPVKLWGASATLEAYHGFLFLGNPLGFYRDQGVQVEFGTAAGSAATLQLVATNQVQMGYIGMDVLIQARLRNPTLPATAVYLHDIGNIYEIVVPEESAIRTVADLAGKNIGVANLASGAIPSLRGTLAGAGLNPDSSVGLIPVGNGAAAAAALRAGRVQALSLFRAQHALIETLGFKFRYFTRDAPSAIIVANSNFLRDNADAATRVLRGIVMASAFAQAAPEATVREFWKLHGRPQGLSEEEALRRSVHVLSSTARLWKDHRDASKRWGAMDTATWDRMQDFLLQQRQIPNKIDSNSLFTTALLDEVNKVDLAPVLALAARSR